MISQIIIKYTKTSLIISAVTEHNTSNAYVDTLENARDRAIELTQYIYDIYNYKNAVKQDKSVKLEVNIDKTSEDIEELPEFVQSLEYLLQDSIRKELELTTIPVKLQQQKQQTMTDTIAVSKAQKQPIFFLKIDYTSIILSFYNNKVEIAANPANRNQIVNNITTDIKKTFDCEVVRVENFIAFIIKGLSMEEVEKQSNRIFKKLK